MTRIPENMHGQVRLSAARIRMTRAILLQEEEDLAASVPELCLRPEAAPLELAAGIATLLDSPRARGSMLSRFGGATAGDPTLRLLDALVAP